MYRYNENDSSFLKARVTEVKDQVNRYLNKQLTDEQFRSLRLRNGLYQELHAHMLRIAIPYGLLNSKQLNQLALVADKYDKGYGHFTTRQNIQFNWIDLVDIAAILKDLSTVNMHAVQTSGKVIRNITTDHLAGICHDEIADPRPYCEMIRQWFTLHPEFSWMGGKFKIAINGAKNDRTALRFHDVGLQLVKRNNQLGFAVFVGGGLGAFPVVGQLIKDFLPSQQILSYLESILRIYNLKGRRDNPKRNRIKFLVKDLGIDGFKTLVDQDWQDNQDKEKIALSTDKFSAIKTSFSTPITDFDKPFVDKKDGDYQKWLKEYVVASRFRGYFIVNIALSALGQTPGNISTEQLKLLADITKKYSHDELRTTRKQKVLLPYVRQDHLYLVWQALKQSQLIKTQKIAHIVSCPGADYCSLAKTSSITATKKIHQEFERISKKLNVSQLSLHISGCENSCAQHHIADIGLLGLIKNGAEFYQITLAGDPSENATIGAKLGASLSVADTTVAVEKIIAHYVANKNDENETFIDVFKRLGKASFKAVVYG